MKKIFVMTIIASVLYSCNDKKATKKVVLKSKNDSFSYMMGARVGKELKEYNIEEINTEVFLAAMTKVMKFGDSSLVLSQEQGQKVFFEYIIDKKFGKNKEIEANFFKKLSSDATYKTTKSGIVYKQMKPGTNIKPQLSDSVEIKFDFKTIEGMTISSSGDKTMTLPMNAQLFSGFSEALTLMEVGSKYYFAIPSKEAFGQQGERQMGIEPYQPIVCEIEIIRIKF